MPRIAYSVTATLPDEATAQEYLRWLESGHVDSVIEGGAHSAMIVRLDPDEDAPTRPRVETRYVFSTRGDFDRYVERVAPNLRADGMNRFPPSRSVRFTRRVGEIM